MGDRTPDLRIANPVATVKRSRIDDSASIRYLNDDEDKRLHEALDAREVEGRSCEAGRRAMKIEKTRGQQMIEKYCLAHQGLSLKLDEPEPRLPWS